jgi:hypothetical protein
MVTEKISLSQPFYPDNRSTSDFQISRLDLNWEGQEINIHLLDPSTGIRRSFAYEGETATNLMIALNKANLSIKSLHRRVLEHLIADGKLAGSVEGEPD